ncbi:hypothetical protein M422DRAFT_256259 [Sphaerobolus stellatus SS14]|uniref:Uncharacterized protein n=1 Tax=Sphaerobolus stellatus (strain SS14) TaxID=990650 RepID=A0A0C9VS35_SPHS4|nr:hypothetical protein M422DRAFT_256259 [Sphaerobolus stellatus SS14]
MTDVPIPAHILAWKASTDVIRMGEIPSADPRRTVRGFVPDKKFDAPAPMLAFDDPYEDDEDRLNKVKKYWRARDKERMLREAHYKELLDAEVKAAERRKANENARALEKAKEEAAVQEREKEKEKEKEQALETATRNKKTVELEDNEVGPSGVNKGKAREVPRTPRKVTPRKSQTEVWSGSEGEEDEEKPQCVNCVKKNITCVPQAGKKACITCGRRKMKYEFFDKSSWAVLDGTKQVVEAVRELARLERRRDASQLEVIWHDHQRYIMEIEARAAADSSAADARMLQLLELKSKGIEVPEDLEKKIRVKQDLVQATYKERLNDLTRRMDSIQKRTAWTKNGLLRQNPEVPPAAAQGTKRKGDNEGDRVEGSKKKKKKKVAEAEDEESTMR